jgi:Activator of Hsp90 ATPase homolog 1-like protein
VIPPLRLSFDVACPVAHAFGVWTEDIGTWWPPDHTVTGERGLTVVLEPGVGGRIYERTPSGVEYDWGEVTVWEPPTRLGYLWHLRRDRADTTTVEIRFTGTDVAMTRVDIEHTGWDRLGDDGTRWRERNAEGWTTLWPHFGAAVERR